MELAKSKAQAKQVYDNFVATKRNEGFSLRFDVAAAWTAGPNNAKYDGAWAGQNGFQWFNVFYRLSPDVHSWEVTTQAA
jgi:hypothetical protein